jgi:hypothetical protein
MGFVGFFPYPFPELIKPTIMLVRVISPHPDYHGYIVSQILIIPSDKITLARSLLFLTSFLMAPVIRIELNGPTILQAYEDL